MTQDVKSVISKYGWPVTVTGAFMSAMSFGMLYKSVQIDLATNKEFAQNSRFILESVPLLLDKTAENEKKIKELEEYLSVIADARKQDKDMIKRIYEQLQ